MGAADRLPTCSKPATANRRSISCCHSKLLRLPRGPRPPRRLLRASQRRTRRGLRCSPPEAAIVFRGPFRRQNRARSTRRAPFGAMAPLNGTARQQVANLGEQLDFLRDIRSLGLFFFLLSQLADR